MYFLSKEDRLYLHKGLIPESREMYIDRDLRGWNWQRPPLEPVYDLNLGVFEVANSYCPVNRDLFLRRVIGVKNGVNQKMIEGSILHNTVMNFVTQAKKTLYNLTIDEIMNQSNLFELTDSLLGKILMSSRNNEIIVDKEKLEEKIRNIWKFERQRVIYRIQEVLSQQPYIGIDALLYQVLPVVVEHKLNGSFLGLSSHLSTDALNFSEPMIVDIKFGKKRSFHKLSIAGYGLTMEAVHSFPVNLGFLVYPKFRENRITIDREFVIIDDELRQKFIENRDEKMRMIYEENDPGLADNCYDSCPYRKECLN